MNYSYDVSLVWDDRVDQQQIKYIYMENRN